MRTQARHRTTDPAVVTRRGQCGIALLEALVAMLVFSLGILGVIATQAAMTREQANAKFRADAALLVSDLTGMMWGDISNISQYTSTSCNSYKPCSDWISKVQVTLPSASTSVTVGSSTSVVSITVSWTLPSGSQHQYQTATMIKAMEAS